MSRKAFKEAILTNPSLDGVNKVKEREYIEVARACEDSKRFDRKDSGKDSVDDGGEV